MGVFKIIFTCTLFSLTLCDDNVLTFELSLPDIMTTFSQIDKALRTFKNSDIDFIGGDKLVENLKMKIIWSGLGNLAKMLDMQRRVNQIRPNVEMGPGAYKTEIVTYPPHYFVNRLKTLLKIKAKEEARNADLNAPKVD